MFIPSTVSVLMSKSYPNPLDLDDHLQLWDESQKEITIDMFDFMVCERVRIEEAHFLLT